MTETALHVWDGIRPRSPRDVVTRRQARVGPFGVLAATERLDRPTDWAFEEEHHTIVVHLAGRLDRMDCEFSSGPSGPALPAPGDIWMIPAGCRYAALAQGARAEFVEIHVPVPLLADAPFAPRVRHRDEILSGAAARLSGLMRGGGDDMSALAAAAVGDTLERHLLRFYGRRARSARHPVLSIAERARLADAIRSQLDAEHSLGTLAALVGLDVRRFTGAFRHAFGLSPWQYVMRARLDEGARLLLHGKEPVTDVALATGFATPSHFATAFARRFGVPPSRYRAGAR